MAISPLGHAYAKLTGESRMCCSSHSAMFVLDADGNLCVGNVKNPTAEWQSLDDFLFQVRSGHISSLRIFRVKDSTENERMTAAREWNNHVHNAPYDRFAYWRLILKVFLGDWLSTDAGRKWAFYCTEGNSDSWLDAGRDWCHNLNPTPVTEIKRWKEGALELL
jgi:hypothetical protein